MRTAPLLACGLLVACGGKPANDFPASVGRFTASSKPSWSARSYPASVTDDFTYAFQAYAASDASINYQVTVHKRAADAAAHFGYAVDCPPSGGGDPKPTKQGPLETKAGAEVGTFLICQSGSGFWADPAYLLAIQRGTRTASTNLTSDPAVAVELLRAMPALADLDLSMFDELAAIHARPIPTERQLEALHPPDQLIAQPYLQKAFLLGGEGGSGGGPIPVERQAKHAAEIEMLVSITCEKGSQIGTFADDEGHRVPAYSNHCAVAIIDRTIPAVIARKTFINVKLPDARTFAIENGKVAVGSEVVAAEPSAEINAFLEGLPPKPGATAAPSR